VASVLDITTRKQAEEALHRSEGELSLELQRMSRVQALSTRLSRADDLQELLKEILALAAKLPARTKETSSSWSPKAVTCGSSSTKVWGDDWWSTSPSGRKLIRAL
jgi:hypothetical protein